MNLARFSRFVAGATLVLIFVGGLVTSTGSGLSVPDWPLSYGRLFPPMIGGILYEHGHRMVAGAVALLMVALCVWILRAEPRRWVRYLALTAVGAVLLQALLGGLTVLFLLPHAVSVSHAGVAEIFFGLTIALATATSRGWREAAPRVPAQRPWPIPMAAAATTLLIYVQILLGAAVRHMGAGLAIPDFPLAFGRLIPPDFARGVGIHYAHRVGALMVAVAVVALVALVERRCPADGWLKRPARLLLVLLIAQIALGALTIWTARSVIPTTLHVAVGASTFATSLALTLRAFRRFSLPGPEPARAAAPGRREVTA